MAESKYLITKCVLKPNGCSLTKNHHIKEGVFSINYFESIQSPSISMTLTFLDVDKVTSRLGITGGEIIELSIKQGDEDEFNITEKKHRMIVNAVKNGIDDELKQIVTLDCVSMESIVNETARLNKKFTGPISGIVKDIMKVLSLKESGYKPKNLSVDQSANSYSFVGNLKRPFDTIQWLCSKTQSEDGFGFLFYENIDGYNFKSINELFKQESYLYKKAGRPLSVEVDGGKILEQNLDQSNDIGMNCRMGMYANKTIYIDLENQTAKTIDFDVSELKLKKPLVLMEGLEKSPSRFMLKASDVGAAQRGSKRDDKVPVTELDEYKNKSYIRNNLLFSQSLTVSIPLNTKLRVGELIECKFPLKKTDKDTGQPDEDAAGSYGSDKTNDISGTYLIAELRHTMTASIYAQTNLKLIRDVFTA